MYYIAEEQMMEQWVIQIPLAFILLEIIAICVIRCILAFLAIIKYKRKRSYCHQAPISDSSYFANAPSYVEKYPAEDPAREESVIQKAAVSTPVQDERNTETGNVKVDNKH